jgi:predicted nucleic acid-binding protein
VKLVLHERESDATAALWVEDVDLYASLLGYAELRAAVAQAERAGRIGPGHAAEARSRVETVWGQVSSVDVDDVLVRSAGDLAERHRLRAADAIHLASAIRIREPGAAFVSFDIRLRDAAAAEGFMVLPESV